MNIKTIRSAQYDANSANNQFREAFGMNKQGTETIRVSMYGNRYNFQKAMNLFGAKQGYGAQLPKWFERWKVKGIFTFHLSTIIGGAARLRLYPLNLEQVMLFRKTKIRFSVASYYDGKTANVFQMTD